MPTLLTRTIQRIHIEKKQDYAVEASNLLQVLKSQLHLSSLRGVRILNRYDFQHPGDRRYGIIRDQVFSDPATDAVFEEQLPEDPDAVIAVEYLPGQFDAKAEAASQAIGIILDKRPEAVKCAKVYLLYGALTDAELEAVRKYLINPVDSREASREIPDSLDGDTAEPEAVPEIAGFIRMDSSRLALLRQELGLAMFQADIEVCRDYFAEVERRDPTLAELKILDTYWSDHCRHTTFTTQLDEIKLEQEAGGSHISRSLEEFQRCHGAGPCSLMDIALAGMKALKKAGKLERVEESEEVNAASVHIDVSTPAGKEQWLLMFKNETHNHPTEIEPYGGAATCLGGAIRDPLSGRSYVYQALRLTGSADPRQPMESVRAGKLPQRVITAEAARGYSSYGNQVGIATGYVHEVYHPGYEAKRMEIGAVVGAVPLRHVRRERPQPGDYVLLIGGATGRDGIGGATGSSKKHDADSLVEAAAEVQKGNPPEERALQRFFRDPEVSRRIKRSNDFGAGGVSVAVGELAEGLEIDLDAVPKKYRGLDGLEIALSESQERMAVVLDPEDAEFFIRAASGQNLQAVIIARVTDEKRLVMNWNGRTIVSIARDFLDSSGAPRFGTAKISRPLYDEGPFSVDRNSGKAGPIRPEDDPEDPDEDDPAAGFSASGLWYSTVGNMKHSSRHGLIERFDATIGARTVLMPFGGIHQITPAEAMAAKVPVETGETETVSVMAAGFDPDIAQWSPYHGGIYAVVEAVSRAVAAGASPDEMYLAFQEYFERLEDKPEKWGKPAAALLGAFRAQMDLEIAAIGGKDSMSGSFEDLHVPPTLAAFAVAPAELRNIRSPEFKQPGDEIVLFELPIGEEHLIDLKDFRELLRYVYRINAAGLLTSLRALRSGGIAAAVAEMGFGSMIGFEFSRAFLRAKSGDPGSPGRSSGGRSAGSHASGSFLSGSLTLEEELGYPKYGSFLVELKNGIRASDLPDPPKGVRLHCIGTTLRHPVLNAGGQSVLLGKLRSVWEETLEEIFPTRTEQREKDLIQPVPPGDKSAAEPGGNRANSPDRDKKDFQIGSRIETGNRSGTGGRIRYAKPRVCIPVFPGTNCEDESALGFEKAGAVPDIRIFRSKTITEVEKSIEELTEAVRDSQIFMIPGGFSAADEPDGAGKYIAAVLRSPALREAISELLEERDGLVLGICNGFQALVRTGLLPFGEYRSIVPGMPTLAVNTIGRHVSRYVHTIAYDNGSPWTSGVKTGEIHSIPVSHGEGRFTADPILIQDLFEKGQVVFRYCDREGRPTMSFPDNPNGSIAAIEGITSPDGRILGKMGHSERIGKGLTVNVPGNKNQNLCESAVRYFQD